jgi:hypothetical protein
LVHFQKVTVSGTGFDSDLDEFGDGLIVYQCVAGEDPFAFPSGCAGAPTFLEPQDPDLWAIEAWVRRTFVGSDEVPVDCAAAPGTCELIAVSYLDPALSGRVSLAFDSAVPAPLATAKVRPRKDLRGGQTVTVSGTGYFPGASLGITQCEEGATDVDDCDISNVAYATADEGGAFSTTFVVRGKIRVGGEMTSCRAHFGACLVGVGDISDLQNGEKASAPIGFRER